MLSTQRSNPLKKLYRFFIDLIEETTTGMARCIVVNSNFTLKVFYDNFPIIRKRCRGQRPKVLYPCIQQKTFIKSKGFTQNLDDVLERKVGDERIVLSLNRYERKKGIGLAL